MDSTAIRRSVTEGAAFWRADFGTLVATGPDRASWLQGLLTCDVGALTPGEGRRGLLLSKQGKIQSDAFVLEGAAGTLIGTSPGLARDVHVLLDGYLVMEDVELEHASERYRWLVAIGPEARSWLTAAGPEVSMAAVPLLGADTLLVAGEAALIDAAARALEQRGAFELTGESWEAARLDRGLSLFGVDYTASDKPHEAGLDRLAVSWSKGCYLGQEVVCMQDMRGKVKRRLVGLSIDAAGGVERGAVVNAPDGSEVGALTSAAPALDGSGTRAFARVKSPCFESGQALSVGGSPARVL